MTKNQVYFFSDALCLVLIGIFFFLLIVVAAYNRQ